VLGSLTELALNAGRFLGARFSGAGCVALWARASAQLMHRCVRAGLPLKEPGMPTTAEEKARGCG